MSRSKDLDEVKEAILEGSEYCRSLLFMWLTSEPGDSADYVEIADVLLNVGERNLSHLVIHRGLALFPDSEQLALYALRLELERTSLAA